MVIDWLDAIASWVLNAPGNSDPVLGPVWKSTLRQLDEDSEITALDNRVFWDFLESSDAATHRPFFVIREEAADWRNAGADPAATMLGGGRVVLAYTETAVLDPELDELQQHTASKRAFLQFAGNLYQWLGTHCHLSGLAIMALTEEIHASRTPPEHRNPDVDGSDFWWILWSIQIGTRQQ